MDAIRETLRKMAEKAIDNASEQFGAPVVLTDGERVILIEAILAELWETYQLAAANGGV